MSRQTVIRTQYVRRHRRRSKSASGWQTALALIALMGTIALAMGAGNWMYRTFLEQDKNKTVQENELEDAGSALPSTAEPSHEITETVAFPAMENYALCAEICTSNVDAQRVSAQYQARGGAGYVLQSGEDYLVLLAAYESDTACKSVLQHLQQEENLQPSVHAIQSDGVELRLTALPRRIDGIRDAFAIWQQTVQMLSDLWQDADSGVATGEQVMERLRDQCEKLKTTCDHAFSDVLIQGEATALDGLYDVVQTTYEDLSAIIANPPQNVLEVSAKIKYTEIRSLTEYQSYIQALKTK